MAEIYVHPRTAGDVSKLLRLEHNTGRRAVSQGNKVLLQPRRIALQQPIGWRLFWPSTNGPDNAA